MKNKGLKFTLLVTAISLFTSYNINAQNSGGGRQDKKPPTIDEIFKQMDKDEDGLLSKKEIKGPLKNDFDKIDTDEDGFLSKEELEKAPKPERKERPRN